MLDKQTIAYLKLVHGFYNASMMLLFIYQGWLGLRIRKQRMRGVQAFEVIKRHRKFGPVLALLGVAGFFAGLVLIYLDTGRILKYPQHFITGLAVVFSIIATFIISRKIKGLDSPWRTPHFRRGLAVLILYTIQVFFGLRILL